MSSDKIKILEQQIHSLKQQLLNIYDNPSAVDENILKLAYKLKNLNEKYEQLTTDNKCNK